MHLGRCTYEILGGFGLNVICNYSLALYNNFFFVISVVKSRLVSFQDKAVRGSVIDKLLISTFSD